MTVSGTPGSTSVKAPENVSSFVADVAALVGQAALKYVSFDVPAGASVSVAPCSLAHGASG